MNRIPLKAEERMVLGKKVRVLRRDGFIPGHVFGKKVETENISVKMKDFIAVLEEAGETGVIDLRIGAEKVRPVMIKDVAHDPTRGQILNIDFYQVDLTQKVTVPVPVVLIGEEPESVHLGETVVLQTISELQVEALPTDLVENIEVDITGKLKEIGDAITVDNLVYDREKLHILAEPDEVIIKLDTAVTEEMKKLLEEQEAEAAAAQAVAAEAEIAEGGEVAEGAEGEEGTSEGGESSKTQGENPSTSAQDEGSANNKAEEKAE